MATPFAPSCGRSPNVLRAGTTDNRSGCKVRRKHFGRTGEGEVRHFHCVDFCFCGEGSLLARVVGHVRTRSPDLFPLVLHAEVSCPTARGITTGGSETGAGLAVWPVCAPAPVTVIAPRSRRAPRMDDLRRATGQAHPVAKAPSGLRKRAPGPGEGIPRPRSAPVWLRTQGGLLAEGRRSWLSALGVGPSGPLRAARGARARDRAANEFPEQRLRRERGSRRSRRARARMSARRGTRGFFDERALPRRVCIAPRRERPAIRPRIPPGRVSSRQRAFLRTALNP